MEMGGGNGQWVRTRTEEGAQLFLEERGQPQPRPRISRAVMIGGVALVVIVIVYALLTGG